MQQTTSRELYAYWDLVRNGRKAPYRFEIKPDRIAPILPETFIGECTRLSGFRFRLAGTRICEQFGRELRGIDFLTLWGPKDRAAVAALIRNVLSDGAVGHGRFRATSTSGRQADFEFVLMPLTHSGTALNRVLGSITAIDPPFWLGSEPLERQDIIALHQHRPDLAPAVGPDDSTAVVRLVRGRFRVVEGGADRPALFRNR